MGFSPTLVQESTVLARKVQIGAALACCICETVAENVGGNFCDFRQIGAWWAIPDARHCPLQSAGIGVAVNPVGVTAQCW